MDEKQSKRDVVGMIRRLVELAMPNLRHYYRMTKKAKVVAVYASDGEYFCDVQPLRNDETPDPAEPVVPRVAIPVLWGGPDRGVVCPPVVGVLCDLSYYDGDPNYPFISNIRWGGGKNAPKAELNEFIIQLENGVEIRIDKEKQIVTLTPENVRTGAGKNWTIKAGDNAIVQAGNRAAFESEIIMRVEEDPRTVVGSVRCSVTAWDARSITALASWRFIDADTPLNLVLQLNKETLEMVIEDADPRENSFAACVPDN